MATYDAVAGLVVDVDSYTLERLSMSVSSGFERVSTLIHISGGGATGTGEDVTYQPEAHDQFARDAPHDLAGRNTLDAISQRLAGVEEYRRWGFESALLDLALRQAGRSLGDVLGRAYQPLRFVVSTRGDAFAWLRLYPQVEFKLDPDPSWSDAHLDELAATRSVRVLDLKGYYQNTSVDAKPDERIYRACLERFGDDTTVEDPWLNDGFADLFRGCEHRLSFDAPIHGIGDIESLPLRPGRMNIKPSRFGSLRSLLDTIDYCQREGIAAYAGGQTELGIGRAQIQELASLFYPQAANDCAPSVYNEDPPRPGLPQSPLPAPRGFNP